jgi:hypothetical protein
MPKNAIHAEGFGVIASSGHVVEDAVQKQCIAQLRASLWAQASIGNDLRLHLLSGVINAPKHLPRRVAHDRVAAMREAAQAIFVIP